MLSTLDSFIYHRALLNQCGDNDSIIVPELQHKINKITCILKTLCTDPEMFKLLPMR